MGSHTHPVGPFEALCPRACLSCPRRLELGVGVIAGMAATCESPTWWPAATCCTSLSPASPSHVSYPCLPHPTAPLFFSSAHCCAAVLLASSPMLRPETIPGLGKVIPEKRQEWEAASTQETLVLQPQGQYSRREVTRSLLCLLHIPLLRGAADGGLVGEEAMGTSAVPGPVAA